MNFCVPADDDVRSYFDGTAVGVLLIFETTNYTVEQAHVGSGWCVPICTKLRDVPGLSLHYLYDKAVATLCEKLKTLAHDIK